MERAIHAVALHITNADEGGEPAYDHRDSQLTVTAEQLAERIQRLATSVKSVVGDDVRNWLTLPVPYGADAIDPASLNGMKIVPGTPRLGEGVAAGADLFKMALDGKSVEQIAARADRWFVELGPYRGRTGPSRENTVIGITYYFRNVLKAIGEWWLGRKIQLDRDEDDLVAGTSGETHDAPGTAFDAEDLPRPGTRERDVLDALQANPTEFQFTPKDSNVIDRLRKYGFEIESVKQAKANGKPIPKGCAKGWRLVT